MKELLALAVLCAPMFSCSPVHAETYNEGITQCSINGNHIYEYMQERTQRTHLSPDTAGNLVLLFTQGHVSVGASSGVQLLDLFAVSQGLEALEKFPLPAKCTAIVPLSYYEQVAI